MQTIFTMRNVIFSLLLAATFLVSGSDLFAQPEIKDIVRLKPDQQNVDDGTDAVCWLVYFTEPISGKSIGTDDFKLSVVSGSFSGDETVIEVSQNDKKGYEWVVCAGKISTKGGELKLDFTGTVTDANGNDSEKGYTFEKGQTYIWGDGGGSTAVEATSINRYIPLQQNNLARNLTWLVTFSEPIDSKSIDTKDFTVTRTSGSVTGSVLSVNEVDKTSYSVEINNVVNTGNLRLDFTGSVSTPAGDASKSQFTSGQIYTILAPVAVTSIVRNTPANQITKLNSVIWRVNFDRAVNPATVEVSDFAITTISGLASGTITGKTGSGTAYDITISGVNKDAELRLDFVGSVTDLNTLPGSVPFRNGQTYIFDYKAPSLNTVHIQSNNMIVYKAIPENTATLTYTANEIVNIVSATIEGKPVIANGSGTQFGTANYTFSLNDVEGPVVFEVVVEDRVGNRTTFNETTDGSFVSFVLPIPNLVILEQPRNLIACDGSLDKFLFVIAASDLKGYNVAYRWLKDGQPITDFVADLGLISFDTLDYKLSGTYTAEMFVYNPRYENPNGSAFSFEAARVSSKVLSKSVNLYVLQKPSFLRDINSVSTQVGNSLTITFDANTYGEHNMEDPTYWTEIDWFKGNVELENSPRIAGADGSILTINGVNASDFAADYRVRLIGECDTVWSNNFAITDEPVATITVQPIDVEGCVGSIVQLSVSADATVQGTDLLYQWMVDGQPIANEANKFSGAMTPNLNVTLNPALNFNGTEEFTCKVTPVGFPNNGNTSAPAKITWKSAPVFTTDLAANYSAKEDDALTLFVTATGENVSYTWTKDGVDLNNDNDTLSIAKLTVADAGDYVVTVSNDCGEITSVVSTLAVTAGPINVVTSVDAQTGLGLTQNYPNPFDVSSTITFNTQVSGNATLTMTDMLGNTVAPLFNGFVNSGVQKTIQLNVNEMNLNTGTYFITLRMGDRVETRQISVVR